MSSVVRRHSTAQHSTALVVVVVVGRSTCINVVEHSHVFIVVVCVSVVTTPSITSSCDGRGGVSPTQGFEDCF